MRRVLCDPLLDTTLDDLRPAAEPQNEYRRDTRSARGLCLDKFESWRYAPKITASALLPTGGSSGSSAICACVWILADEHLHGPVWVRWVEFARLGSAAEFPPADRGG